MVLAQKVIVGKPRDFGAPVYGDLLRVLVKALKNNSVFITSLLSLNRDTNWGYNTL